MCDSWKITTSSAVSKTKIRTYPIATINPKKAQNSITILIVGTITTFWMTSISIYDLFYYFNLIEIVLVMKLPMMYIKKMSKKIIAQYKCLSGS